MHYILKFVCCIFSYDILKLIDNFIRIDRYIVYKNKYTHMDIEKYIIDY